MIRRGLNLSDSGHIQVSGYIKHLLLVSSFAGNSMWWAQVTWNRLHVHLYCSTFCFSNANKLQTF